MSPDKEAKIFAQFPRLYAERQLPPRTSSMCFGFSCDDGWFEIIAKLSAELEALDSKPVAVQVKQKFGELRFSLRQSHDRRAHELIAAAKAACARCEVCGRPGVLRALPPRRWLKTACDEHGAGGVVAPRQHEGNDAP